MLILACERLTVGRNVIDNGTPKGTSRAPSAGEDSNEEGTVGTVGARDGESGPAGVSHPPTASPRPMIEGANLMK